MIARDNEITIHSKNLEGDLFSKPLTQSGVFASPFMHIFDLNSDGLDDLLFYEKKRNGKISILLNTGDWKNMLSPADSSMSPLQR